MLSMPKADTSEWTLFRTTALSSKGRGVACAGRVEVCGALAGEEVLAQPAGRGRAFLRQVVHPSVDRVLPRCRHSPDCGGCAFQQMDYASQLRHKEQLVRELFATEVRPIIGSSSPFGYRNKMEFSFSEDRAGNRFLGLMRAGSKGRVLNLDECHLVSPWFTQTLAAVRAFWQRSDLSAYHHRSDRGHLRTLMLREAIQGKGKMALLTVSGNPQYALSQSQLDGFVAALKKVYPEEDLSVFLQVQQLHRGRPTQFFEMLLAGPDHITETLHVEVKGRRRSLQFKISPTSFFQPNTLQAQRLYSVGLSLFKHLEGMRLFDLYCGGATIGLSAAPFVKEVVGVESNPHSVFDAKWNGEVNQIDNISIVQGDVGEVLEKWSDSADLVVVDPPRSGLSEKAMAHIMRFQPKELLYISCNPATQAENVKVFLQSGYQIEAIQPIDQFPHTVHLENIVHLVYPQMLKSTTRGS